MELLAKLLTGLSASLGLYFFFLWIRKINRGTDPSPFFLTCFSLIFFNLLGAPYLLAQAPVYNLFQDIQLRHSLNLYLLVYGAMFLFLLGATLKTVSITPPAAHSDREAPQILDRFFLLLLGSCYGCAVVYVHHWKFIPLWELIRGSDLTIEQIRAMGSAQLPAHNWRYQFFLSYLLQFCCWYFVYRTLDMKEKKSLILAGLALSLALYFLSALAGLQKAPFVIFLFMTTLLVIRIKKISLFSPSAWAAYLGIGLITASLFFIQNETLIQTWNSLIKRIFLGQNFAALFYLDAFPEKIPFLKMSAFPSFGGLFTHDTFPYTQSLWDIYFSSYAETGLDGSIPSFYLMQFYAAYGWPGALLAPVFMGMLVRFLSDLCAAIPTPALSLPFSLLVAETLMKLSMTGASIVIFNLELALIALLTAALCLVSRLRRFRFENPP